MFVHTFFPLLPPEKYFDEHPEWYSEIDGKRKHEHAQLCLTNDEMRKELTRNALAVLRNDPGAGVISISQNDWHGRCQCAKCRAVEEEEGAPSGLLLAVRQRRGRGDREGVPRRPGRDARLPVHANAAQAGQAAAKRRRAAVLDRVLVRPAAGHRPAEREVPRRHRGLEQDRPAAVRLGLRHQLLELHPAAPEPSGVRRRTCGSSSTTT